jgi:hypothetical protein
MGNFAFTVPSLGSKYIDYRIQIPGDSFNWNWVHPLSEYTQIVIHHSAGPDTQTPDEIAGYHISSNGWGGIGYHFVITKNGTVYYVGDLTTARAHVANLNHQCIGVCLIGSFIEGREPPDDQLRSASVLCAQMLFRTPELSGVENWTDVIGHKNLGSTRCPGDSWATWRARLLAAGEPSPQPTDTRRNEITQLGPVVLGRSWSQSELDTYVNSTKSIEQIRRELTESVEHRELIRKAQHFLRAKTLAQEAIGQLGPVKDKVDEIARLGA